MKTTVKVTYLRRVSFEDKSGRMTFMVGQKIGERKRDGIVISPAKFRIHQIKETFLEGNHIIDINVSPIEGKLVNSRWKRIVNASLVNEYNIDFLCEV